MKLRYSAPCIRRGLFYLLIVSPLLRGSNPYPNGSLTYRKNPFFDISLNLIFIFVNYLQHETAYNTELFYEYYQILACIAM